MDKKLLNEDDPIIGTVLNCLESFLCDGVEKTLEKLLEELKNELKNELNNPIKLDAEKIFKEFREKKENLLEKAMNTYVV